MGLIHFTSRDPTLYYAKTQHVNYCCIFIGGIMDKYHNINILSMVFLIVISILLFNSIVHTTVFRLIFTYFSN